MRQIPSPPRFPIAALAYCEASVQRAFQASEYIGMQRHSGGVPEGASEMRRGKRRYRRQPEVRPTYVRGRIFLPVVEWRTLLE